MYTFKSNLAIYARTGAQTDLNASVDELRRLVLSNGGSRVTKSNVSRSYQWMQLSYTALAEVNEGYKHTYGGAQRLGGVEMRDERAMPALNTQFQFTTERSRRAPSPSAWEVEVGESAQGRDPTVSPSASTPRGYKDLTPTTRNEWNWLVVDREWTTAAVAIY